MLADRAALDENGFVAQIDLHIPSFSLDLDRFGRARCVLRGGRESARADARERCPANQDLRRSHFVLRNETVSPVKGIGVLGEEREAVGDGDLSDDLVPLCLQHATLALVPPMVPLEGCRHAQCNNQQHDDDDDREDGAHERRGYAIRAMSSDPAAIEQAYRTCERLAHQHYENFPVASRLLPRHMRRHIAAVYAFARHADDLADEGDLPADERLALLEDWDRRLDGATSGRAVQGDADERDLIFVALARTIHDRELPVGLFSDLVSAFRQDVTVHRYETWDQLLDYCRRSANPVGRLVLRIAGVHDAGLERAADDICTALQITNFLQDFGRDWKAGRLYVPAELYTECGAKEEELDGAPLSEPWRQALAEVSARTDRLFDRGRPVCDRLGGRLGLELKLTWLGGRRVLARLEQSGYDPLVNRPRLDASDYVPMLWHALVWHL